MNLQGKGVAYGLRCGMEVSGVGRGRVRGERQGEEVEGR